MQRLTITNSQARIHDFLVRAIARYLTLETGMEIVFVTEGEWGKREALLEAGEMDLGWICGASYVEKRERGVPLSALAAPVMAHERYGGKPVYFSDVLVRADSHFRSFEDLRGARWVYNEPGSHSGYHMVKYSLARRGLNSGFFKSVVQSGAHENSVQMLLEGKADASAIDSMVWQLISWQDHSLAGALRVMESLGTSPMPPLVAAPHVPEIIRVTLCEALIGMKDSIEGRSVLQQAQLARIVPVSDHDYRPIREILKVAEQVEL